MPKNTLAADAAPETTDGAPVEPTEATAAPADQPEAVATDAPAEPVAEPEAEALPAPVEQTTVEGMLVITRYDLDEAQLPKAQ